MGKTFTYEEAQTLLPVLGALLLKAREAAVRAQGYEEEMQALSQRIFLSGGLNVDVSAAARRRAEREKSMQEARSTIEEIEQVGVTVAESEEGMLEFPLLLDGRVVLLCWKAGEDSITKWRETEDDASVRREVDARFFRRERERPN